MPPASVVSVALFALFGWMFTASSLGAQDTAPADSRPESRRSSRKVLRESEWLRLDVEGVTREAWIHLPWRKREGPSPVVFGFHGRGGSARHAAAMFRIHDHWPEALVVSMQGLPAPGGGGRAGWQHDPGEDGDRDLKFFDAVLANLKREYAIDEDRVYATGHSNGGAFTYLLWAQRPEVFAAFAPSAAGSRTVASLTPKPAMHVAGEKDTIVSFQGQMRTMAAVRAVNGCTPGWREWMPGCRVYPSTKGAPFISFIHPGDHRYPAEAPALIVAFFKEQVRRTGEGAATRR